MYKNELAKLDSLLGKLSPQVSEFASMRSEIGKYKEMLQSRDEMEYTENPERLKKDMGSLVARVGGVVEAYRKRNPEYFYDQI